MPRIRAPSAVFGPEVAPQYRALCLKIEGLSDIAADKHIGHGVLGRWVAVYDHQAAALEVLGKACRRVHHKRRAADDQEVSRGNGAHARFGR